LAQYRSIQNDAISADPDVILYHYSASASLEALLDYPEMPGMELVIDRRERAIRCNQHALADCHTVAGIDHNSGVYIAVAADYDVAGSAGRLDLDE
jgi:hypothetical protein